MAEHESQRPGKDEKVDELRDRLVDRALAEVIGNETPPDLSPQILAAVENQSSTFLEPHERESIMSKPASSTSLGRYVVVASVFALIGAGIAVLATQSLRGVREVANADASRKVPDRTHHLDTVPKAGAKELSGSQVAEPTIGGDQPGQNEDPEDEGKLPDLAELPAELPLPSQDWFFMSAKDRNEKLQTGISGGEQRDITPSLPGTPKPQSEWIKPPSPDNLDSASAAGQLHDPGTQLPRGRDRYERIIENAFKTVAHHPLSTFSIDVDTASYSNTRQYLMQSHRLPPPDAVRIEELINYFAYGYEGPSGDDPFASHIEVASCPWQPKHRLVRVALKGKEIHRKERPKSNLVFLIDVSGSMNSAKKLPLVKQGLKLLVKELGEKDRVAMVVYAGAAGLVLDSTVGDEKDTILAALDKLNAGGSTAGGAGIKLAYQTAVDNYIEDGTNRVILCSDGDFNVGVSGTGELEKLAEKQAKSGVFLSVMGFGRGNLNDAMMERITNKGNGNYAYIDSEKEARKVFVEQMSGTLVTIAKDVKIQIEFNPSAVAGYRLIGYENRLLAKEDFNDDTKDAGEIGAGHTVTALYEVVPAGEKIPTPDVDDLKYQKTTKLTDAADSGEMLTLKLRYKQPTGEKSKLLEFPVKDTDAKFDKASEDFKFASAVASFGMLLRGSKYAGDATYDTVLDLAEAGKGADKHGYRAELLEMIHQAKEVDKRQ